MTQLPPQGRICSIPRITFTPQRGDLQRRLKPSFFHSLSSVNNLCLWQSVFCLPWLLVLKTIERIYPPPTPISLLSRLNNECCLWFHLPLGFTFLHSKKEVTNFPPIVLMLFFSYSSFWYSLKSTEAFKKNQRPFFFSLAFIFPNTLYYDNCVKENVEKDTYNLL